MLALRYLLIAVKFTTEPVIAERPCQQAASGAGGGFGERHGNTSHRERRLDSDHSWCPGRKSEAPRRCSGKHSNSTRLISGSY